MTDAEELLALDEAEVELATLKAKLTELERTKQSIADATSRPMSQREYTEALKSARTVHVEMLRVAKRREEIRRLRARLSTQRMERSARERVVDDAELTATLADAADDPEALLRAASILLSRARADIGLIGAQAHAAIDAYLDSLEEDQ